VINVTLEQGEWSPTLGSQLIESRDHVVSRQSHVVVMKPILSAASTIARTASGVSNVSLSHCFLGSS
jgi:hypothetical protein